MPWPTLGILIAACKRRYEETSGAHFDDTGDWTKWLNWSARAVALESQCFEYEKTYTTQANVAKVLLESHVAGLTEVYYDTTRIILALKNRRHVERVYGGTWMDKSGTPLYAIWSPPRALRLVPYPTAAGTSVLCFGFAYPRQDMNDAGDPCELPEEFHEALEWRTVIYACVQDVDNPAKAADIARYTALYGDALVRGKKALQGFLRDDLILGDAPSKTSILGEPKIQDAFGLI